MLPSNIGDGTGEHWGTVLPAECVILTLTLLALHGKNESKSRWCPPLGGAIPEPEPENGVPRCECRPWVPQPQPGALSTWKMPPLSFQPRTLNLKTAPQNANAAPEFRSLNWAPFKLKMPSFEILARWKRRPKMQMPPLGSATITRRILNPENAAL